MILDDQVFCNWFVGFVDGEGYFGILEYKQRQYIGCRLAVELRDDDAEILYEIQELLGIGRINRRSFSSVREQGGKARDSVVWQVNKIGDLLHVLVPLFEKYPLRTKKKWDFEIWAKAVRKIYDKKHLTEEGSNEILQLKQDLLEVRRYKKCM